MVEINPTAFVEDSVELDQDVQIGPFCRVTGNVKIGSGTHLVSHVVIEGKTTIGRNNVFHPFSVIGGAPQDLNYKNEPTELVVGDGNTIRESATLHRGSPHGGGITRVGNNNMFMACSHVAHDCVVGNENVLVNHAALAGHVELSDHVIVSGLVGVVQRVRIGSYSFLGAGAILKKDLPPFMAAKEFSNVTGPNIVGLKRNGMSRDEVRVVSEIYKMMYKGVKTTAQAIEEIEKTFPESPAAKEFCDFVRNTKIGIQR